MQQYCCTSRSGYNIFSRPILYYIRQDHGFGLVCVYIHIYIFFQDGWSYWFSPGASAIIPFCATLFFFSSFFNHLEDTKHTGKNIYPSALTTRHSIKYNGPKNRTQTTLFFFFLFFSPCIMGHLRQSSLSAANEVTP